jgi:predicted AAA+ superfamily ATPase
MRGSRSGRVAWQFARDHAGRHVKKPASRSTK